MSKVPDAVGYLRRSTDEQDRSLGDQRTAIEMFAKTHSIEVVGWYVDDAISGTRPKRRDGFQKMVEEACQPKCRFGLILVYDIKRFGRMDNDETGYYRHLLRVHGVRISYTSEGFTDGFTDDLIRPVKQWQARQESKDLAKVVIRGYLSKFDSGRGGWWMSGVPPYGYDRRYEDAEGKFLFVVRNLSDRTKVLFDERGRTIRTVGAGERLNVSDRDRCRLVLGDPAHVVTVKRIFFECTENGLGCTAIAQRFNHEGIPTFRKSGWGCARDELWKYATIRNALLNPAYVGTIAWNRSTAGIFYRIADRRAVERLMHETATSRPNAKSDWLVVEEAHEAMVSRRVFEEARELSQRRYRLHRRFSPDYHRQESDFRAVYVLTGLLECAACGMAWWGNSASRLYSHRRRKPYRVRLYVCGTYKRQLDRGCGVGAIRQRVLERIVSHQLIRWFRDSLLKSGKARIKTAALQQCQIFGETSGTASSHKNLAADARAMASNVFAFLDQLPAQFKHPDQAVRRLAYRRCLTRVLVDLKKCELTLWVRRLPILAARAGGQSRIKTPIPRNYADRVMACRKGLRGQKRCYDLTWHTDRKPTRVRQLALKIRAYLRALHPEVCESFRQRYIGYSHPKTFASLKLQQARVVLYLKLDLSTVERPPVILRDVQNIPTQTTGNAEISIASADDWKIAIPFVRQAFRYVSDRAMSART